MYNWVKAENITVSDLEDNKPTEVRAGEKRIGLLKRGHHIYAFAALCPHAGGNLCEGWVDMLGRIVCPVHKYRFDPKNGRNTSGEGYKLFTYPLEVKGDDIYIGLLS